MEYTYRTKGVCSQQMEIETDGDIITHVNGTPVTTTEEIGAIKNELQVGDTMTFTIWRDGEIIEIEVALVDTNDIYG